MAANAGAESNILTQEELLRRASAMVPVLKSRAARTEELRRIPDETVQDILSSGLHLIGVPKRFGGLDVEYGLAGCGKRARRTDVVGGASSSPTISVIS